MSRAAASRARIAVVVVVAACAASLFTGRGGAQSTAPIAPRAPLAATLEQRGQERAVSVEVLGWDRDGVEWRATNGSEPLAKIRWDEIRSIDGLPPAADDARTFGERLWRARTRLERGDFTLAAPLFEALAESAAGEDSQRERIAVEGVLRIRMRAGDAAAAILAALRAMELDRDGVSLPTGSLVPAERLASLDWPVGAAIVPLDGLLEEAEIDAFVESLEGFAGPESSVALEAAAIAQAAAGRSIAPIAGDDPSALAAALVRLAAVRSASPESSMRDRERLLREAGSSMLERWWQAHLGERLLAETDPAIRRRGLLEWLAVAAAHPGSPDARIALRRASRAADALGEDDLADRLAAIASDTVPNVPPEPRDSGIRP